VRKLFCQEHASGLHCSCGTKTPKLIQPPTLLKNITAIHLLRKFYLWIAKQQATYTLPAFKLTNS